MSRVNASRCYSLLLWYAHVIREYAPLSHLKIISHTLGSSQRKSCFRSCTGYIVLQ